MHMKRNRGFTLIELLVVLGIVALLLTLAVPRFFPSVDKTAETILAENLRTTRAVIDQFYADTGRYPESLEQLVEKKYLPRAALRSGGRQRRPGSSCRPRKPASRQRLRHAQRRRGQGPQRQAVCGMVNRASGARPASPMSG
jgi:prepilin-type N-terminal cleavage/methylation domain-containing protein